MIFSFNVNIARYPVISIGKFQPVAFTRLLFSECMVGKMWEPGSSLKGNLGRWWEIFSFQINKYIRNSGKYYYIPGKYTYFPSCRLGHNPLLLLGGSSFVARVMVTWYMGNFGFYMI